MPQLTISESMPVVLSKHIHKIIKGEFVEMAELLTDKKEVERRPGPQG